MNSTTSTPSNNTVRPHSAVVSLVTQRGRRLFTTTTISLGLFAILSVPFTAISGEPMKLKPCGDKPNCVCSIDTREAFFTAPLTLSADASLDAIEQAVLSMPRLKLVNKESDYLHFEATTLLFRFTDDLELQLIDGQLMLRSASRVGHSDLGANRKRIAALTQILAERQLIIPTS